MILPRLSTFFAYITLITIVYEIDTKSNEKCVKKRIRIKNNDIRVKDW